MSRSRNGYARKEGLLNLRLVKVVPATVRERAIQIAGSLSEGAPVREPNFRYQAAPIIYSIVEGSGAPLLEPTLFLAKHSLQTKGATSGTPKTYGECLLDWLRFLPHQGEEVLSASEESLQVYRASLIHGRDRKTSCAATATANLRVTVVVEFYRWCERNGFHSPLGLYLLQRSKGDRSLTSRVIKRHPKILSLEEINRILRLTRPAYRLAFQWGLVTGLRRFEVASLRLSDLPTPSQLGFSEDGLASFEITRKGGKRSTVYAPVGLVEATQWHVLTERASARGGSEAYIFLTTKGERLSETALSREFRRCANEIGSRATLHHLRHTFAVHVLNALNLAEQQGSGLNSQKVVQVLLGHSSMQSTERYLEAISVTAAPVGAALEMLFGGFHDSDC